MKTNSKIAKTVAYSVFISCLTALVGWLFKKYAYPYLYRPYSPAVSGRNHSFDNVKGSFYWITDIPAFDHKKFDSPDLFGSGKLIIDGGKMQPNFMLLLFSANALCSELYGYSFLENTTSGYRTSQYNATLPKASPNSNHMKGLAVDVAGFNKTELAQVLFCVAKAGLSARLYTWPRGYHIHIDLRQTPSISYDSSFDLPKEYYKDIFQTAKYKTTYDY